MSPSPACVASSRERSRNGIAVPSPRRTTWWKTPTQNSDSPSPRTSPSFLYSVEARSNSASSRGSSSRPSRNCPWKIRPRARTRSASTASSSRPPSPGHLLRHRRRHARRAARRVRSAHQSSRSTPLHLPPTTASAAMVVAEQDATTISPAEARFFGLISHQTVIKYEPDGLRFLSLTMSPSGE